MTDDRVASLAAQALTEPGPALRAASAAVKALVEVAPTYSPELVASVAVQAIQDPPTPDLQVAGVALLALVPLPAPTPDGPELFQWHSPIVDGGWARNAARSIGLLSFSCSLGRPDAVSRGVPATATLVLGVPWTNAPQLGERFRVSVRGDQVVDDAHRPRFTGEVTDVQVDPRSRRITVTAVGQLARYGRRVVDGRGWGTRSDGVRVDQVLRAAGAADLIGELDGGTAQLIAPADRAPAQQLLDLVADSTGGVLVEQRDGLVDWHDAEHRRDAVTVLELTADQLRGDGFTWSQRVADLVNVAEVTWGRDGKVARTVDHTSVDDRDEYPVSVTTALATESDAYDLGAQLVGRRSEPTWQLPAVTVDLFKLVDDALRAQLLALRPGHLIRLSDLPAGGPFTTAELFVEGIAESADVLAGDVLPVEQRTRWQLTLAVSDPRLSGVALRWLDVPDDVTWDDVDPALTWLDLASIDDPADLTP